jgi:very-short-patch-repair endonuclease
MQGRNDIDHRIAAFAADHHAVASHAELRELGLGAPAIEYRLAIGRLHRTYKAVYAIGHPLLTREGRWRAAVLASGKAAVLSHWDAAVLWGLMPSRGQRFHVTKPSTSGRDPDRTRIQLHRVGTLRPWECTITEEIPTTTVARTLLDLSPELRPRAMEDAIAHANRLGLFDLLAVRRCLDEHPRQHGAPTLRRLLDALAGTDAADLRSMLEVLLLQLCDDHHLPVPATNAQVEGFTVDFYWPHKRLIIEADSYTYHSMPSAFERDRERDQRLTLAGYIVVRFTYKQVTRQRQAVADRIRRLLT